MSSIVSFDVGRELRARVTPAPSSPIIDVALLGCGNVGSAFAVLAQRPSPRAASSVRITTALVRDPRRHRPALHGDVLRTDFPDAALTPTPDVVVELLGGTEPARTIVLDALQRGVPVVTANKSLLAAHGRELREAAAISSTPLFYEAAVLAGVPFLGTFARRPYAAQLTSVVGIANGTSNYVLTRAAADRTDLASALAEAQRLGLAEPDPSNDVDGVDALEKLVVLLQHFAAADVAPPDIERTGIRDISSVAIDQARELGGTIKPLIFADWTGEISAFVGPAFVPDGHSLARVDGAENALVFDGPRGRLTFRGPGAGPDITAATVLDDVLEAARPEVPLASHALSPMRCSAAHTSWLLSIAGESLPHGLEVADLLAAHGVYLRRTGTPRTAQGLTHVAALSWPCTRPRLERALRALAAAARCRTTHLRAIGD